MKRSFSYKFISVLLTAVMLLLSIVMVPVNASQMQGDQLFGYISEYDDFYQTHKGAIDTLARGMWNMETNIYIREFNVPRDDAEMLFTVLMNTHPELFYVSRRYYYKLVNSNGVSYINRVIPSWGRLVYDSDGTWTGEEEIYTESQVMQMRTEFRNRAQWYLNQVDDSMSDYQKALILHDLLALNSSYLLTGETYDLMVNGYGKCYGYSEAYSYLLEQVGIKSEIIESDPMFHQWNKVKIGGKYYHADVTWDDPVPDQIGFVDHKYFMLSDSAIGNLPKPHYSYNTDFASNDTRYDNMGFHKINTQHCYVGDTCYVVDNNRKSNSNYGKRLLTYNSDTDRFSTLYSFEHEYWEIDQQTVYADMYMALQEQDAYLYMNTEQKVLVYDTRTGTMSDFAQNRYGKSFYGLRIIDNKVYAVLGNSPLDNNKTLRYVGDCLVREEPTTEEPTTEEPTTEEPTTEEPTTEEPTTEEPTTEEPTTEEPTTAPPRFENGYYLIGPDWDLDSVDPSNRFEFNNMFEMYYLSTHINEGDRLKVVKIENDQLVTWYPDGYGNEYFVEPQYAGDTTIYFSTSYNEAWSHFGGHIYLPVTVEPTTEEPTTEEPTTEEPTTAPPRFENGYYLIGPDWNLDSVDPSNRFEFNNMFGMYYLSTHINEGDRLKVVKIENDQLVTWYPDGYGNEYFVEPQYAGDTTIYFSTSYNEAWSHFGGNIYLPVMVEPTTEEPTTEEPTTEEPTTEEPTTEEPTTEEPTTEPKPEDVYIVAGSMLDIFHEIWDGECEANTMSLENGVYTKTYTVDKTTRNIQIKVVKNNDVWYGDDDGNNITFNMSGAGSFTVTFDPVTEKVTVTGEKVVFGSVIIVYSIHAAGNGEGHWMHGADWDPAFPGNTMTQVAEGVWEITFDDVDEAFDRQMKFAINSDWAHCFGGTFAGSGVESDAVYDGPNITFDTEYESQTVKLQLDLRDFDYTTKEGAKFTVTIEDTTPEPTTEEPTTEEPSTEEPTTEEPTTEEPTVAETTTVPRPEDIYVVAGSPVSVFQREWDGTCEANRMTKDGDLYTKTFTVDRAMPNIQLKVVKNNRIWYGDDIGKNVKFRINAPGTFTVTFNTVTEDVTVTGDDVVVNPVSYIDSVNVVGNGEGAWLSGADWNTDFNRMALVADNIWETSFENVEEAFDRQFKFAIDGSMQHCFGGTFADSGVASDAVYDGTNITFDTEDVLQTVKIQLDLRNFDEWTKTGAKFTVTITPQEVPTQEPTTEEPTTEEPTTEEPTTEEPTTEEPTTEPVLQIHYVNVTGNGEGAWLNNSDWDPSANRMNEVADGIWEISYDDVEEAFDRQFQFAVNGNMIHYFGGTYVDSGVVTDAVYTGGKITFDTEYEYQTVKIQLDLRELDERTMTGAKFTVTIIPPGEPTEEPTTAEPTTAEPPTQEPPTQEQPTYQPVTEPPVYLGDVDCDGEVTINDATLIQMILAEYMDISELNWLQRNAADTNRDGRISIKDVTEIQRHLAEIITLPLY